MLIKIIFIQWDSRIEWRRASTKSWNGSSFQVKPNWPYTFVWLLLPPAYVVRREGTVFTGVCLSTGGGQSAGGGGQSSGVGGVSPAGGGGGSVQPGGGVSQDRTTEWVFTTRQVVCLLRSRRRTFLLPFTFVQWMTNGISFLWNIVMNQRQCNWIIFLITMAGKSSIVRGSAPFFFPANSSSIPKITKLNETFRKGLMPNNRKRNPLLKSFSWLLSKCHGYYHILEKPVQRHFKINGCSNYTRSNDGNKSEN